MDRLLPRQFIALLYDGLQNVVCVRWGNTYSSWFKILAGVRQGGILSPILFAVYMDLRRLWTWLYRLLNEFYGSLLYADDILLITHTVHAMQNDATLL